MSNYLKGLIAFLAWEINVSHGNQFCGSVKSMWLTEEESCGLPLQFLGPRAGNTNTKLDENLLHSAGCSSNTSHL